MAAAALPSSIPDDAIATASPHPPCDSHTNRDFPGDRPHCGDPESIRGWTRQTTARSGREWICWSRNQSVKCFFVQSLPLILATLTVFLTPHLNTLPVHATLSRSKRASFPLPCLLSSGLLLALALPFALVPYYLLPSEETPSTTPITSSGVFNRLPADDGWVNLARVLQCALSLGTCNMWLLRCRDSILGGLEVDRNTQYRIARWIGLGLWVVVLLFACIGGWLVEKIELLGVMATLAVGWLLPCESSWRF